VDRPGRDPYRRAARWYDRVFGGLNAGLRGIALKMFPARPGIDVLDVGCGTRAPARRLPGGRVPVLGHRWRRCSLTARSEPSGSVTSWSTTSSWLLARATVVPAVNQIEVHPYFAQREVQDFGAEHGILTQAWSPIGGITFYRDGSHGSTLADPVIAGIATTHGKTAAQVMLRWGLQHGRSVNLQVHQAQPHRREHQRLRLRAVRGRDHRDRRPGHRRSRRPRAGRNHPRNLRSRDPGSLKAAAEQLASRPMHRGKADAAANVGRPLSARTRSRTCVRRCHRRRPLIGL
jgi:hypothetical protein